MRMSACRSACHRNNFRRSRVSDGVGEDSREDVHVGVGVGVVEFQLNPAVWNSLYQTVSAFTSQPLRVARLSCPVWLVKILR